MTSRPYLANLAGGKHALPRLQPRQICQSYRWNSKLLCWQVRAPVQCLIMFTLSATCTTVSSLPCYLSCVIHGLCWSSLHRTCVTCNAGIYHVHSQCVTCSARAFLMCVRCSAMLTLIAHICKIKTEFPICF